MATTTDKPEQLISELDVAGQLRVGSWKLRQAIRDGRVRPDFVVKGRIKLFRPTVANFKAILMAIKQPNQA